MRNASPIIGYVKPFRFALLSAAFLAAFAAHGTTDVVIPTPEELKRQCDVEYAQPVRPGNPETGAPFWNIHAVQFMYAPAFDFRKVAGAVKYRYTVTDDIHKIYRFEGASPWCTLAPVWKDLVTGQTSVVVEGLDAAGHAIGLAGEKAFWKAAPFKGKYPPPARTYAEAARRCAVYMLGLSSLNAIYETGKPDPNYFRNAYPSKMHSANVHTMLKYAKVDPTRRDYALGVARAEAEYLLTMMQPADAALPYFTLTYLEPQSNDTISCAGKFVGQSMNCYPAAAGGAFLAFYEETKDAKFLDAAKKIASTYLREQLPSGTWYVKQDLKDGKPIGGNLMIPTGVMNFLDRLFKLTGDGAYRAASDRAFAWIEKNPLKTWYWEGHFEDTELFPRYENLTKHTATDVMLYILNRFPKDPKYLKIARELLRFSEDQFLFWENCKRPGIEGYYDGFVYLPGVAEQYACWYLFDSSAAKMINSYLAMYRAEGNVVDLMKAKALADTMTRIQQPNGRIPTPWSKIGVEKVEKDWMNCMGSSISALQNISQYQSECDRIAEKYSAW